MASDGDWSGHEYSTHCDECGANDETWATTHDLDDGDSTDETCSVCNEGTLVIGYQEAED